MQNQYGADQTLAAGNFVIAGAALTTKAAYGSSLARLTSAGNHFVVITLDAPGQGSASGINAAVNRNSAVVQVTQLGQAPQAVFIDYGSSPLGIGIGLGLAPNQIILGFSGDDGDSFSDPTGLCSYRVLSCFDGVNNVT